MGAYWLDSGTVLNAFRATVSVCQCGGRSSSVDIVTRLQDGQLRGRSSIPLGSRTFMSSANPSDLLWSPVDTGGSLRGS